MGGNGLVQRQRRSGRQCGQALEVRVKSDSLRVCQSLISRRSIDKAAAAAAAGDDGNLFSITASCSVPTVMLSCPTPFPPAAISSRCYTLIID